MKISQDHYRHIHEQRDFTLENLSLAGQTDVVDYDDLRVLPEFDFESDAPVNSGDPHVSYRFRVPEAIRIEKRIKNRYYYIGGVPLPDGRVVFVPFNATKIGIISFSDEKARARARKRTEAVKEELMAVAWNPARVAEWCLDTDERREFADRWG